MDIDNLPETQNSMFTKESLPKLTQPVIDGIKAEIMKEKALGWNSLTSKLEEWSKEIESENPAFLCFFQEMTGSCPPSVQPLIYLYLVSSYRAMKIQAIENNLYLWEKTRQSFISEE